MKRLSTSRLSALLFAFAFGCIISVSTAQIKTTAKLPNSKKANVKLNNNNNINSAQILSPAFWTKAPGLPDDVFITDIEMWNNKFYLATSKGIYFRGLLPTVSWQRFTPEHVFNSASHRNMDLTAFNFKDIWKSGDNLYFMSGGNSSAQIFYIKSDRPNDLYYQSTKQTANMLRWCKNHPRNMSFGIRQGYKPFTGNNYVDAIDSRDLKLETQYLRPSGGFSNGRVSNVKYYEDRAFGELYEAGYIKSDRSADKPSLILGGDGFILRNATTDNPNDFYWHYIDKGFSANSGKIQAITSWANSNTIYVGTSKGYVYKSTNRGSTWSPYFQGALDPAQFVTEIYNLDNYLNYIYAATNRGIFVTNKQGNTADWKLFGALPNGAKAYRVFATVNEILVSTDKGVYRKKAKTNN